MEKKFILDKGSCSSFFFSGSTLQLMPTGNSNSEVYEIDYFCLTGEVDESAKNWIRLYSSVMPEEHTGEERIIVEDGKIYIKVLPNVEADSRNGIVHLTTMASSVKTGISNVQRIKNRCYSIGAINNSKCDINEESCYTHIIHARMCYFRGLCPEGCVEKAICCMTLPLP